MNLVIVESPSKGNTIKKFLGSGYKVLASYGHIRDLPKSEFGVDVENDFEPKYIIPLRVRKNVNILKKEAEKVEAVILASVDYKESILVQCPDNLIHQFETGNFIDNILKKKINFSSFKVPAFDSKTQGISFKSIERVIRHPAEEKILKVRLDYGREISITPSHSVFTKNKKGEIKLVLGKNLKVKDKILIPLRLPRPLRKIKEIDILKAIYNNGKLRSKVFISSAKVSEYQKKKVLAPKTGNTPQFLPRLILSSKLRRVLIRKRKKLGWSQKFLANKINCSQPHICELEKSENPTLVLGKRYLESLGLTLEKVIKNPGAKLAPSSIETAIKNALENQWRDSRKSLTHTFQPLNRFSWKEIEKNFKTDREIKISRHNHSHLMPRFVPVNKDLMLFLGYFIAEGSYLGNGIRFSFGKKIFGGEKENIERTKEISKRIFNLSPSDFEYKSSNSVVLGSSLVNFLIKDIFNIKRGAKNKNVPWIVFNVPPPLQFAFLEGLFLGDGSLGKENITFNTISPKLAHGIRLLFLQNGILTSHSLALSKKQNRKPLHQIIISNKKRLLKIQPIWEKHYKAGVLKNYLQQKNAKSNNKKNRSLISNQKNDLGLLKIKSIKKVKSSKPFVYDFSVEGENFICGDGGICAHNTDQDREGEAIAWHLTKILNLDGEKSYQRIVFHEITKSAIEEALKNPRKIDLNLVEAQQTRRILDRIVGYKLSPFLWKKVARGLSAGRVQSVAVRLVVEREREIEKFIPQEYWIITALLKKMDEDGPLPAEFEALLVKKDGETIPKLGIKKEKEAEKIIKDLKGTEYRVINIEKKETKRNPLPPFTTSTLQQESWYKFRFPSKLTMRIAQNLYEKGFITYHRTDSLNLSDLSLFAARKFIIENYGKDYWAGFLRKYKTKSKGAQEAHEAIRPTYPANTPDKLSEKLEGNQLKLYDLIWRRFIACQMAQAIFDSTTVDVLATNYKLQTTNYTFRATGQILKFDGFLKIYPIKYQELEIPPLEKDEILELLKLVPYQHFTQPPPRYNEATLIKELEKNGIGRPSTYAPILSTIQERNYIEKDENRKFKPTEIGFVVNDLLVAHFPEIVDIGFTAGMEEDLDKIAEGEKKWVPVIKEFYNPFEERLQKKYEEVSKKDLIEETDKVCPKCGSKLIIRLGKFGKFYACSKFPKCRYTESLEKNNLGIKCPKCQKGEIGEKRTKKGKIFYGCSNWPNCDFALWDKPTGEKCPKCGSLLVETKRKPRYHPPSAELRGRQIKCSNKECDFELKKE